MLPRFVFSYSPILLLSSVWPLSSLVTLVLSGNETQHLGIYLVLLHEIPILVDIYVPLEHSRRTAPVANESQ